MKSFDNIMKQEVTRAEFLKLVGVAAISIFGVSAFLANLSQRTYITHDTTTRPRSSGSGFGARKFGE